MHEEHDVKETHHSEHKQTANVVARLSRVEGHVAGIKKMVVEQKPCDQILIQIAAVRSALNEVAKIVMDDHMNACILEDVANGKTESLQKLRDALNQYMK